MRQGRPHLVQYQGSKRLLAPQIVRYLPHHFNRLLEPFAGMAAISIAAAAEGRAMHYLLNDLNTPVMRLLEEAIMQPRRLIREYEKVWKGQFDYPGGHLEHYYAIRELFNAGETMPAHMLYLLARCVKGSVRYGRDGNFNQSPDKRRHGTSPQTLALSVLPLSSLLTGKTTFSALDYREFLKQAQPGDVVYMDPPYQGVSSVRDTRYISGVSYEAFAEAVEDLESRNIDYLISYDGSCGEKAYGKDLPTSLRCTKVMLKAGLSSQATLLGRKAVTYEALYVSNRLLANARPLPQQETFLEALA